MAREAPGSSTECSQTLSKAVHKEFDQSSNKAANWSDTQGHGEASAEWPQRKKISGDTATFAGNVLISAWGSKTKLSGLSSLPGTHLAQQLCGVTCKLVCGRQRHSKANKRDVPKRESQG